MIIAIDPGPERSAWILWDQAKNKILDKGKASNFEILSVLEKQKISHPFRKYTIAIEMVASYGMAVGKEVFETCVWIGRFEQKFLDESGDPKNVIKIKRLKIKLNLCHDSKAKDSNIRQALIDRFGGTNHAIGGKKCKRCKGKGWFGAGRSVCQGCHGKKWEYVPGPLFDITGDEWSALAVAVTIQDTFRGKNGKNNKMR